MAFQDMVAELRGSVPKISISYAPTLINRAWRIIRESNLWSFNVMEGSWITPPPIIGVGTCTFTQGSPNITFDTVIAVPAINSWQTSNPYVLVTQMQIRVAVGGIYNIISYNSVTGAAILDRNWGEPGGSALSFQLYQLYYVAPVQDWLGFISVRNPQMFMNLDLSKNRGWLDQTDPQRTWYQFPSKVVPWGLDIRGAGTTNQSATYGYPLYELWGQPVMPFTYQWYGLRRGSNLVNPTDTLPIGVPEELVLYKARQFAYEWAEANKDIEPRSSGPDFRFLWASAQAQFKEELIKYRRQDREVMDNYCINNQLAYGTVAGIYNTLAGVAAPYAPA
jgi:hypothetical protein